MVESSLLERAALFAGLSTEDRARVGRVGLELHVKTGHELFRLGEEARSLFVVVSGAVDLVLPLRVMKEIKDVRVQTLGPGDALAWSALVPPHRLTMGARVTHDAHLLAFPREALLAELDANPRSGLTLMANLARLVGGRLLEAQALWIREVQRHVSEAYDEA